MKTVESHEAFVGALVTWMHTPRGGYGYSFPVDAKIEELNPQGDRAKIRVTKADGSEVLRFVHTKSLRWRPNQ